MTAEDRQPVPDPAEVLARLRARNAADAELRAYVLGLLDGMGIARARLVGIDDTTGELLLTPED